MTSNVKEQVSVETRPARRTERRIGLSLIELIGVSLAVLSVILLVIYYFTALGKIRDRLSTVQQMSDQQQKTLIKNYSEPTNKAEPESGPVRDPKESLEVFQSKWLKPMAPARIAVLDEINQLARKTNVRLTSGIELKSGEGEDQQKNSSDGTVERARSEKSSSRKKKAADPLDIFPKAQLGFSVLGQYAELRRFVNELEQSKQFIIIDRLSLNGADDKQSGGVRAGKGGPVGVAGVSGVSLAVSVTIYFHP
jgi:hypothetical protein